MAQPTDETPLLQKRDSSQAFPDNTPESDPSQPNQNLQNSHILQNIAIQIHKNVSHVKSDGFINYFGLQRFGTKQGSKTHETGRFMLQKDFESAFWSVVKADISDAKYNALIQKYENSSK